MIRLMLLALLAVAPAAAAQPSPARIAEAARTIIDTARYATLVTVGANTHPQARIVDPTSPDERFTVFIATIAPTRKVAEIEKDNRVTLGYFDTSRDSAVTLLGRATLVRDAVEKKRRWKADWSPFYPQGPDGSDVVLIRVEPFRLEVVSVALGMNNDPKTWRPVTLDLPVVK